VSGKATAQTTVLLDGGCTKTGCQSLALAGDDGRWKGEVRVAGAKATLSVSTADSEPLDTVNVRVKAAPEPKIPDLPALPQKIPTAPPAPDRVYLVGDSLAVGIEGLLPQLLAGKQVQTNALVGRPLADGMRIIAGLDLTSEPTVLAVSLFTNDAPTAVPALETAVKQTVAAVGQDGCAVWATIVRPPLGGVSYAAANDKLRELEARYAPRLVIVPWAETIASDPALLAGDGVHGTPAGYQARAQLYAQAVDECSP
jgi:lysophospholipase L1-like esterase